jgi:hypothetical protein
MDLGVGQNLTEFAKISMPESLKKIVFYFYFYFIFLKKGYFENF